MNDKKSPESKSDKSASTSAVVPSTQPVPKKEDEIRAANNVNIKGSGRAQ